jgi:outer membrane protein assembly complex protein YaeT
VIANRPLLLIGALVAALLLPLAAFAQTADRPTVTVLDIQVQGNQRMTAQQVLDFVHTRVGQKLDEAIVRQDEQRLLQTRNFDSVYLTVAPAAGGVVVTVHVQERPVVAELTIEGNQAIRTDKLLKDIPFRAGDALDRYRVQAGRQAIETAYRDKNFAQVEVAVDESALAANRVIYQVREGPKIRIRKINFRGNDRVSSWTLRTKVESSRWFWPLVPGKLDYEQVDQDAQSLRDYYIAEGYLDVTVQRQVTFSPDGQKAYLTFTINEGPRYRVNEVVFNGNAVYPSDELGKALLMTQGEYYTAEGLQRDTRALQNAYGQLGHLDATVRGARRFLDPDQPSPDWAGGQTALVDVVYEIHEADAYRVGSVIITGNDVTQDRVIRRHIRVFPEQVFNTVALEESRKRLLETRLFAEEGVSITPAGASERIRDVLVQVREGQTAEFLIGVGVSTNAGLIGNVSLTQRNFDLLNWPDSSGQFFRGRSFKGAGQTLSLVARPGTELNEFYIDWFEPALLDQPYTLGQRFFFFERQREDYDENRYGSLTSLGRRFKNGWYAELAQRIEQVQISNIDEDDAPPDVLDVEGGHVLLGTKLTLVRDRTDSRWMPSTGDRLRLSYEQVYGSFGFGKAIGEYSTYRTLRVDALDRKSIWSNRFTVGSIFGDAPIFERFYAGGMGSIRGFGYRGVGPRSTVGDEDPIGGKVLLLAGTEYEFPLVGKNLRGAVFLDSGTVEQDWSITNYRISAGVGIRWVVPLFGPVPMMLDFAVPVSKGADDDTQVFSFSVGANF